MKGSTLEEKENTQKSSDNCSVHGIFPFLFLVHDKELRNGYIEFATGFTVCLPNKYRTEIIHPIVFSN